MNSRQIVVGALAGGVGALVALSAGGDTIAAQQSERRIVRVVAERFLFTPSEIKLQVGDEIEIRLKSEDTAHGFRLLGTDTNIVVPKRGSGETSFIFKAETEGRFTFECSRMCGAGHNFMRGVIVVTPPGDGASR
jgi:cytochrome c oxidase subunit 2